MIFEYVDKSNRDKRVFIEEVEVAEHGGNSAICRRKDTVTYHIGGGGTGGTGGTVISNGDGYTVEAEAKFQP
jgi:hypothetical protein